MTEELVKQETQVASPNDLIQLAIEKGAELDKLEKVLELKFKYEANEARKSFNSAMVDVHKNMPTIQKTLKNSQTHSQYAALDEIIRKTKNVYTDKGFSIVFYEGKSELEEHIRICADVIHREGHKETYYYDVPLDGKGIKGNVNMTAIHGKASSTSYGRRYLMCMIWNIPTGDDNDGNGEIEYITEKQAKQIDALVVDTGASADKVLGFANAETYNKILAKDYKRVIAALEARKEKQ